MVERIVANDDIRVRFSVPASHMIELTKIVETCFACPSAWEAWDTNGTYYYFRYRWGFLEVTKTPTKEDWQSPLSLAYGETPNGLNEQLYGEQLGDSLAGVMSYPELTSHLQELFVFPAEAESRTLEDFE